MSLKDKYIEFFKSKDHVQIPSAPVVPENDPSVLFNTAGMQPLVPYLKGAPHPSGTRLCDYQKCLRTNDLDEIGDSYHHTFFEMLGNWSLGDYFKKESITWSFEFLTKWLNMSVERLAVTVFKGNELVGADEESAAVWKELGIKEGRLKYLSDNWWPNMEATGPCGPDTEIFYWRSDEPAPEVFDDEDERWVEIWNNVFMQFMHNEDGTFTELPKKNVDTGMGVERVVSVLEGVNDNYESSIFKDIISKIEEISSLSYADHKREMRIIADHVRSAVFISADPAGIKPSNTDQGYILRRLIRRVIRYLKSLNVDLNSSWDKDLVTLIIEKNKKYYPELEYNKDAVFSSFADEKHKFAKTLNNGLKEFEKVVDKLQGDTINKDLAFRLYDTYGFPIELTIELANERNLKVDEDGFKEKFKEHQEKSRAGASEKFKGGLASSGEMETKYHTATHLLNAALKEVVSKDIHQKGSNITQERLRFDFNCDHKLTDEEKQKVEALVNSWIQEKLDVTIKQMQKQDAVNEGAEASFIERYPDTVNVYSIGDISKEICGGPHVKNTSELGIFKIKKEEAVAAGIRRIKAVLE